VRSAAKSALLHYCVVLNYYLLLLVPVDDGKTPCHAIRCAIIIIEVDLQTNNDAYCSHYNATSCWFSWKKIWQTLIFHYLPIQYIIYTHTYNMIYQYKIIYTPILSRISWIYLDTCLPIILLDNRFIFIWIFRLL